MGNRKGQGGHLRLFCAGKVARVPLPIPSTDSTRGLRLRHLRRLEHQNGSVGYFVLTTITMKESYSGQSLVVRETPHQNLIFEAPRTRGNISEMRPSRGEF